MAEPAVERRNAVTEAADALARINRERGYKGDPVGVGPGPSVRTPAMGTTTMSVEELTARNVAAIKDGIDPSRLTLTGYEQLGEPQVEQQTQAVQRPTAPKPPGALPDFTRIRGIDLENRVLVVDTTRIPLPAEDVSELFAYALNLTQAYIADKLTEAGKTLGLVMVGEGYTDDDANMPVRFDGHQSGVFAEANQDVPGVSEESAPNVAGEERGQGGEVREGETV